MFENEHDFRKLVGNLKIDAEPNPAHRERLRGQVLQTYKQTEGRGQKTVRAGPRACPTPGNHRGLPLRVWLAVAAAILVVATVGVWSFLGQGPVTFRQVRLATQKMPWLYAFVSRYQGSEVRKERHWCNFAAEKAYARMVDDGSVVGWEYGAGQRKLVYTPRLNTLTISDLSTPGVGGELTENLPCVFAVFAGKDDLSESTMQYDGKTVRAFEVERAGPGSNISGSSNRRVVETQDFTSLRATIMADPQTKHVVAASIEYQGSAGDVLAREEWVMSYPQSGPASLSDLGVPASVTVIDRTRRRIGTPGVVPTPAEDREQRSDNGIRPSSGFRLMPVEIRLPKPMFDGTPYDSRTPNLERPRGSSRPPFLAPAGTTNVALGKPVSSSDPEPVIGSLSAITDGDKEATDGSFVELSPGPQYVMIDLQERCEIEAVLVWHFHRWARVYRDVVVQVSDDPAFKTGVKTIFNNDVDDSLGFGAGQDLDYVETYEGKLMEGKGAHGRYVRLFSNGNTHDDLNHYTEVEVYGRPLRLIQDH